MGTPHPITLRCAFDLGRAENEFRWLVVNVIVGGVDGTVSLTALDRVGIALEPLATAWLLDVRTPFEDFRGEWRDHLSMDGDWEQTYADALQVNTEESQPGSTPAERVLTHLWSFVEHFRQGLEQIVKATFFLADERVKAAYALGRVLDQGTRPAIALVETEVAPSLGYDALGPAFQVPTLRQFIREVPNPDHAAWKKRRAIWLKKHGANSSFDEPEPVITRPAPNPHQPGELPPSSGWSGGLRGLWERLDLDHFRPLPESVVNVATAAPATRVALVEYIALLAREAFNAMRPVPVADRQPEPETLSQIVDREWAAKLTGCTQKQRIAFLQFKVAALQIA